MNVRNMTMMIVSMAIAVVIVTGVLVPVIADSMSDDSSGYTNTGDFHYNAIKSDTEEHTIVVALENNMVSVTVDGTMA